MRRGEHVAELARQDRVLVGPEHELRPVGGGEVGERALAVRASGWSVAGRDHRREGAGAGLRLRLRERRLVGGEDVVGHLARDGALDEESDRQVLGVRRQVANCCQLSLILKLPVKKPVSIASCSRRDRLSVATRVRPVRPSRVRRN